MKTVARILWVPMPCTMRDLVSDLHALLQTAHVPGPYGSLKFTRSLPTCHRIDKKVLESCYMNIDPMHAKMNSLMPDWSPSGPTALNTPIKRRLDPFMHSQRDKLLHLREWLTVVHENDERYLGFRGCKGETT